MNKLLIAASVVATLAGAPLAVEAADCDITIGLVMELTGPAGAYGQAGAKAIETLMYSLGSLFRSGASQVRI